MSSAARNCCSGGSASPIVRVTRSSSRRVASTCARSSFTASRPPAPPATAAPPAADRDTAGRAASSECIQNHWARYGRASAGVSINSSPKAARTIGAKWLRRKLRMSAVRPPVVRAGTAGPVLCPARISAGAPGEL
eukprot:scaffold5816_cov69-Isochrysis_galbana.AAC.1